MRKERKVLKVILSFENLEEKAEERGKPRLVVGRPGSGGKGLNNSTFWPTGLGSVTDLGVPGWSGWT